MEVQKNNVNVPSLGARREEEVAMPRSEFALDPLLDGISSVELIRCSGSDLDIVNAARVSYGKVSTQISERDKTLINFLMQHEHTSPFEHTQLSFRIKTPIFVARQWMRHRMHSYNEVSYRYVKAPLEFYIPQAWRHQDKNNRQSSYGAFENPALRESYVSSLNTAIQAYEFMLDSGVCREQARGLLPVCTYTEFVFTTNLHAFMHFIRLRIKADAQYEIRVYAQAMLKLALPHFPIALEAFARKIGLDIASLIGE